MLSMTFYASSLTSAYDLNASEIYLTQRTIVLSFNYFLLSAMIFETRVICFDDLIFCGTSFFHFCFEMQKIFYYLSIETDFFVAFRLNVKDICMILGH